MRDVHISIRRCMSRLARPLGVCAAALLGVAAFAQDLGPMPLDTPPASVDGSTQRVTAQRETHEAPASERQPLGAPASKSTTPSRSLTATSSNPSSPTTLAGTVRTILSLAGVVAMILGIAYAFKRLSRGSNGLMNQLGAGGRAPSGVLSILGRYPVSRGTTLVLLKADRRVILLCQTAGKGLTAGCTMQTLTEFTDPEDVASILLKTRDEEEASLAQRFEAMLSREDDAASRALHPSSESVKHARPANATSAPTRAARAAAKRPEAVLRPVAAPSDPRAQIARAQADRADVRPGSPSRNVPSGPLLRGVVA